MPIAETSASRSRSSSATLARIRSISCSTARSFIRSARVYCYHAARSSGSAYAGSSQLNPIHPLRQRTERKFDHPPLAAMQVVSAQGADS